jgi:hypothetical protein
MLTPILKHPSLEYRASRRIALPRSAWLTLSLIALACGEAATPEPPDQVAADRSEATAAQWRNPTPLLVGNQLRNPGFESGTEGWGKIGKNKSVPFEVVGEPVHSGNGAAHLVVSWKAGKPGRPVSVLSTSQEISPPSFPDRIAGWYRVDRWEDTPDPGALQLQILVVAIGDPRTREIVELGEPDISPNIANFQLRYQLAGPTEAPDDGGNIKTRVIGKGPPELGSWLHFDLPVKSDFKQSWGSAPENFRYLRIMFAVRWDDKEEGAALHADVYYDDLFFGFEDL